MCGIAGCISLNSPVTKPESEAVVTMTHLLSHRGPDHEGFYFGKNIAFGHRRLAIIDPDAKSNQPMTDREKKLFLVFNGEIYNYAEIRKNLEKEYTFKTDHSDTETIIYAYKKWGIEFVHRLNGMFALVIYDARTNEAFFIRDRLGKKPLYYVSQRDKVFFSSEIKPFFKAEILPKEINESAIYNYLTFLTTPAPDTFFKNIRKLEAGCFLHVTGKRIEKKRYWNIADYINRNIQASGSEATNKTKVLLEQAIAYRNVSDVPVTVALSGGIDSSLNLYYSKNINPQVRAINLSYYKTSRYDESSLAKKYSESLGIHFQSLKINDNTIKETISEYMKIQNDMPSGDPNTFLLYYISRYLKKQGLKVLLVGEGGDEIGGYPIYLALQQEYNKYKNKYFLFSPLKNILPARYAKRFDLFYKDSMISRRHIHGFYETEKSNFWRGSKEFNSYSVLYKYMSEIRSDLRDSFLRKILNVEYKLRLPELILSRIDYPTMAASIEARSPFMDYRLIEYSSSLDFSLKMESGAKTLLKNNAKNVLPRFLLDHPKVGFGMLLQPFYKEVLPKWFNKELISTGAPIYQFVSENYLNKLYYQNERTHFYGNKLWILYSLNKWLTSNNF